MLNVPFHHHGEALVAIRIARILAEADLVHGVADHLGDQSAIEWSEEFVRLHGVHLQPITLDRAQYAEELKKFIFEKARCQGWVNREARDTFGAAPADFVFKEQIAAVRLIEKIPAFLPRSRAHRALVDEVTQRLQQRALSGLRCGNLHHSGVVSFEQDGPFEKLLMHGVRIATCAVGERDPAQWIAALESNLGIQVRAGIEHQIVVEIDGKEVACTEGNVRVHVFNNRMMSQDGDSASVLFNFTGEGLIKDAMDSSERVFAGLSAMYDDVVNELVGDESAMEAERDRRAPIM